MNYAFSCLQTPPRKLMVPPPPLTILDPPLPNKPTPTSYGFPTVLLEPISALRGGGRHCET